MNVALHVLIGVCVGIVIGWYGGGALHPLILASLIALQGFFVVRKVRRLSRTIDPAVFRCAFFGARFTAIRLCAFWVACAATLGIRAGPLASVEVNLLWPSALWLVFKLEDACRPVVPAALSKEGK